MFALDEPLAKILKEELAAVTGLWAMALGLAIAEANPLLAKNPEACLERMRAALRGAARIFAGRSDLAVDHGVNSFFIAAEVMDKLAASQKGDPDVCA